MSEHTTNCEQRHDDLAAYALHALDAAEASRLEEHLTGCSSCSERLSWLQPAIDVLPVTVAQLDPPAGLRERLMATVEAEAAAAAPAATRAPARTRRRFRLPVFGEFGMRPALAGFGVALLLVAGVAGYALHGDSSTGTAAQTYEARSPDRGSVASGTLVVKGDEGSLTVSGLPPAGKDEVYQAWVRESPGSGGSILPSSVFVVSGDGTGTVAIPHGLSGAAEVMVTREPKGGSEHPGEEALLSAEIR